MSIQKHISTPVTIGVILIVVGVFILFCDAQTRRSAVYISPNQIELGRIIAGKSAEAVLLVENAFQYPITIEELNASCGCATAQVSPKEIPAGDIREVVVSINN